MVVAAEGPGGEAAVADQEEDAAGEEGAGEAGGVSDSTVTTGVRTAVWTGRTPQTRTPRICRCG